MPNHRIAKRAGTLLATAGASPNTVGLVADNLGSVTDRNAVPAGLKWCSDGSTIIHIQDCVWQEKAIANGSATSLFDVACASGATSSGSAEFIVDVTDGTDFQTISGYITYGMVNKAGTNTLTITYATANDAKAVSAGTLTLAWTFVTGTSKGTVKLQPTTSLTATVNRVILCILPVRGAVTVL